MKNRRKWIGAICLCLCLLAACAAPVQEENPAPPSGGGAQSVTSDSDPLPPGSEWGSKPYSAPLTEDETPAYFTCRIVDGAEDGSLLLAELGGDGPYSGKGVFRIDGLDAAQITLDGQPIDASGLQDGMTVTVGFNGAILETFPARLDAVYSIAAHSIGTEQNPGGTCYDLCGLYLQVLDDLWKTDSALNENISQIALDIAAAPGGLTESEQAALIWRFGELHGVEAFAATYEELLEEGCIINPSAEEDGPFYEWKDGCLFSIKPNEGHEGEIYSLPVIFFNAEKWRSSLGAYCFYDCSAGWAEMGTWSGYTVGSEMIS